MTTRTCPVCAEPVRDQHVVCKGCVTRTRGKLADQEALRQELDVAQARDVRMQAPNDGGRSADTPLPYDERASELIHEQHNILVGWVRLIHEELIGRPQQGPTCRGNCGCQSCREIRRGRMPANTIAAMACHIEAWLDRLALHEAAGELVTEIRDLERRILRALDYPDWRKFPVGPCIVQLEDGTMCPGEIEARLPTDEQKHRAVLLCKECGAEWHSEQWMRLGTMIIRRKGAA